LLLTVTYTIKSHIYIADVQSAASPTSDMEFFLHSTTTMNLAPQHYLATTALWILHMGNMVNQQPKDT